MKTILAIMLALCSTQVFAEEVLICNNPVHVTEDKYKDIEIKRVDIDRDGTRVHLADGRVRIYSPAIACYYESN